MGAPLKYDLQGVVRIVGTFWLVLALVLLLHVNVW